MIKKWKTILAATVDRIVYNASADDLTKKEVDDLYAWLMSVRAKPTKGEFNGIDSEFNMIVDIHRHTVLTYDPVSKMEKDAAHFPDTYRIRIKLCGPVGAMFERQFS